MKRLLLIIAMMTPLLMAGQASAQAGLKMNDLFEGRVIPQQRMVETRVRGKSLEKYQLSYYRSLRLNVTDEECGQLRQLLGQDAEQSIDMRTPTDGTPGPARCSCLPLAARTATSASRNSGTANTNNAK